MVVWGWWSANECLHFSADRKVHAESNSTAPEAAVLRGRSWSDQVIKAAIKKSISRRSPACSGTSILNPRRPVLSERRILQLARAGSAFLGRDVHTPLRVRTVRWKASPSSGTGSPPAFSDLGTWSLPPLLVPPSPPAWGESGSLILCVTEAVSLAWAILWCQCSV